MRGMAFLAVLVLVCGCMCGIPGQSTTSTTTTIGQSCPEDYILVGTECCLDGDGNGICDSDEEETTTTVAEEAASTTETTTSTTETVSTTSTTTTSTTTTTVACRVNGDCGQRKEERVCYNGDIYTKRTSPLCSSAGTAAAKCMSKVVMDTSPTERCGSLHCIDGECTSV